jgi:hypothetical protein
MTPSQRLQTPRILWFAMFATTFLFIGFRFVLPTQPVEAQPFILPVLGLVAMTCLVMSFVMPNVTGRQARLSHKLAVVEAADPNATSDVIPGASGPTRRVFADRAKATKVAFATYQTGLILGMALSESVAICGMMLWFMGFGLAEGLPFFVLAWISMGLRFPTLEKVFVPLERAYDAVIPRG